MSRIPPITHAFVEWQQAAGSLLTLQTALSRSKRAVPATDVPDDAALEAMVDRQRRIADSLFRVAFAEAHQQGDGGSTPPPAAADQRPSGRAGFEPRR